MIQNNNQIHPKCILLFFSPRVSTSVRFCEMFFLDICVYVCNVFKVMIGWREMGLIFHLFIVQNSGRIQFSSIQIIAAS